MRPRDPVEPIVRFETPPGRLGQVDFGSFNLPWGRRQALLVVLGHSRLLWLALLPEADDGSAVTRAGNSSSAAARSAAD